MSDKRWKAIERLVAKFWGGQRNPTSGEMSGHGTHADVIKLPGIYVEVKHGGGVPASYEKLLYLWHDTAQKAAKEGRIPVLVLHPKRLRDPVEHWPTIIQLPVAGGLMVQVPQGLARNLVGSLIPKPSV